MDEDEYQFNEGTAGVLAAGSVEYSAETAAVDIDKLIEMLQDMKAEGVETVLMSSGNYRGAKWQSLGAGWGWMDEQL